MGGRGHRVAGQGLPDGVGVALAGKCLDRLPSRVWVLRGDSELARVYPERYFETFIAEQQMVAAATGLAVRGYKPFASTFAAFFARTHDFIPMAAISGVCLRLVGSHAGVEIGADGPSQMGWKTWR